MKTGKALATLILTCITAITMAFDHQSGSKAKPDEALTRRIGNTGNGKAEISNALVRALNNTSMPGGFVMGGNLNNEIEQGEISQMTMEELLNKIISINRNYRWLVDDGVINLIPLINEPVLLNFKIAEFHADNLSSVEDALNRLLAKPDVQKRIADLNLNTGLEIRAGGVRPPGSRKEVKSFSVHCQNKTFRETLNAIARSQGRAVWEYRETHWDKHHGFSIIFLVQ
jgi:hypothetical protein